MEPSGEQVFGQADQIHDVTLEPDGVGHRSDQDAFAEPAHPWQCGVQLKGEHFLQALEGGERPGLVQASKATESALDDTCGVLLFDRHPGHVITWDQGVQKTASPGREIVPCSWVGDRSEPFHQLVHELPQRDCRLPVSC